MHNTKGEDMVDGKNSKSSGKDAIKDAKHTDTKVDANKIVKGNMTGVPDSGMGYEESNKAGTSR